VACIGKHPTLDDLPEYPPNLKLVQWMKDFGINDRDGAQLMHFCNSEFAATKQMLPNLITMLQCCHDSGHKMTLWYYNVQTSITNYFRTKGSCLFLDDAKEILSGEMVYDMSEVVKRLKQCQMAAQ
jgi:hypothetical protein